MPEKLKRWPGNRRAKYDPYPFDKLFDGEPWELVKGKDYQCKTSTASSALYTEARKRGIKIRTTIQGGGRSVVVQALTKEKS